MTQTITSVDGTYKATRDFVPESIRQASTRALMVLQGLPISRGTVLRETNGNGVTYFTYRYQDRGPEHRQRCIYLGQMKGSVLTLLEKAQEATHNTPAPFADVALYTAHVAKLRLVLRHLLSRAHGQAELCGFRFRGYRMIRKDNAPIAASSEERREQIYALQGTLAKMYLVYAEIHALLQAALSTLISACTTVPYPAKATKRLTRTALFFGRMGRTLEASYQRVNEEHALAQASA